MRTSILILGLVQMVFGGDSKKEHVHFKIHVPEIIKHHIHTKTVFIHVHPLPKDPPKKKEPPKKKHNHYEESKVEDWSSYSSYDNQANHEEVGDNEQVHKKGFEKEYGVQGNNLQKDIYDSYLPTSYGKMNSVDSYGVPIKNDDYYNPNYNSNYHANYNANYNPNYGSNYNRDYNPNYGSNYNSDYGPNSNHNYNPDNGYTQYNDQGMAGYTQAPQYAIHEDVDDIPNNDIGHYSAYEEGHKRSHESETGHLITKDLKDFYDDKFDEAEDLKEDGYHNKYDKQVGNGYQGNYDKEIGYNDRSRRKIPQKRMSVLKLPLR